MLIGHFAVGLASKRAAPRTSLGWLMAAPMALDLLWPVFLLAGIEHVRIAPGITAFNPLAFDWYPWSHSLLMTIVWSLLGAGVYWRATRYQRGAIVIGIGVFSHWVFDAITHRPDLPLWPGSPITVGLGLWNSVAGTVVVELALFVAGVWIYSKTTSARDAVGRWSYVGFVAFCLLLYSTRFFAGLPPSVTAIAYMALFMYLIPVWAWWFDAHRSVEIGEEA